MKLTKKLFAIVIAGLMTTSIASCTAQTGDNQAYNIGICQLAQHDALDAATEGFKDYLTEKLGEDKVNFDYQNASGDSPTTTTIINGFVANDVDLIMANATASIQAAQSGTTDIPILGTSITDYSSALSIEDWTGVTGTNISGTTDLAPLDGQAQMLNELFPNAKNVGLVYCSAEPNSAYQIEIIKPLLEEMGYTCTEFSFTDSNDISSVVTTAVSSSDVIYIPTDNTAASSAETIANIVIPAKVPVVAGEENSAKSYGVATLAIDYYELGKITGEMAYEVLVNGEDISKMEVRSAPSVTKKYNADVCTKLGIEVPSDYVAIE